MAAYCTHAVLSGPAASVLGACALSGLQNAVVADMGGTTTDLGVLVEGRPRVTQDGADVGGWRTMVRAIDVLTAQPEWDGRTVVVYGSSQGGAQA